jgi:hypothetical protein
MDDPAEKGNSVVVRHRIRPVADKLATAEPATMARKEGLLKGRVRWKPGTFEPMTEEELAEFDGTAVLPR